MPLKPLVSVITPVYNQSQVVLRMVESLRRQARLGEIILINDHSNDQETTVFKTITGVRYFENAGNEGFVKSNLRGVKKAEHDYFLFLNSDTEAYHDHCLEYLASNLDDGAAIAGALLLYPKDDPRRAETIQHAGVHFTTNGYPVHILSGYAKDTPAANVRRSVPAVTGACLMISRQWWEKLGGFDQKFGIGVFEDVDLCIRARKSGGEVIYDPRAMFTHYEHASQDVSRNWFSQDNLHRNFSYLLLKHGQQDPTDSFWFKGV